MSSNGNLSAKCSVERPPPDPLHDVETDAQNDDDGHVHEVEALESDADLARVRVDEQRCDRAQRQQERQIAEPNLLGENGDNSSHRGWRLTAAPPRASSCWPPAVATRGPAAARRSPPRPAATAPPRLPPAPWPPPRQPPRPPPPHQPPRPGRRWQRRVHHQAGRQRGEHRPDLLRPPGERPQPAPHRRGRAALAAPRSPGAHHRRPLPPTPARSPPRAPARRAQAPRRGSTCVTPHPRHRALRGQNHTSGPSSNRNRRSAAFPHLASTPPHDGHTSSPPPSCRSTASRSAFTVSTTPPSVNPRPSRLRLPRRRSGRAAPMPT